jgi:undecaprenyl diphosphate synthase
MTEARYPPRHIAIIMDGNGRWASKRGLPRIMGHAAGADNVGRVTKLLAEAGVRYLTLYMFSSENWGRPEGEVNGIINLLEARIGSEASAFHAANIKLRHLGRLDRLSPQLRQKIEAATELTGNNTGLTLCLAFDYGGREEILRAAGIIACSDIRGDRVDEALFEQHLYTGGIPAPDLIIRTGGEMRLSNFLLWQAAYSELYFTPVLWPDFGAKDAGEALREYKRRKRRFGRV